MTAFYYRNNLLSPEWPEWLLLERFFIWNGLLVEPISWGGTCKRDLAPLCLSSGVFTTHYTSTSRPSSLNEDIVSASSAFWGKIQQWGFNICQIWLIPVFFSSLRGPPPGLDDVTVDCFMVISVDWLASWTCPETFCFSAPSLQTRSSLVLSSETILEGFLERVGRIPLIIPSFQSRSIGLRSAFWSCIFITKAIRLLSSSSALGASEVRY